MYQVKLEQFQGPLDLLLKLCEEQKLEINKISLANIADQYLKEITEKENQETAPSELADFLLVATELLYIKSKILLPFLFEEEEEERGDLEERLKEYKRYLELASQIHKRVLKRQFSFLREGLPSRSRELLKEKIAFIPDQKIAPEILLKILKEVISSLEKITFKLPQEAIKRVATLEEKIKTFKELLEHTRSLHFKEMVSKASSKLEVVLTFLAVLELVKQRYLQVEQEELWGEIIIKRDDSNDFKKDYNDNKNGITVINNKSL